MKLMNGASFRTFIVTLITNIIAKGDARAKADAATIATLSSQCSELALTVENLKAALAAADAATAAKLAEQATTQAAELDALSSELESTFNPTPTADAVAEVVKETPEVPTPPVVEASAEVGTVVETPAPVAEAAVDAIAETVAGEAVEVAA